MVTSYSSAQIGLFDLVDEADMLQTLARHPLEQALETLIEEAKARGHDNITVALACYGETVNWASQDLAPHRQPTGRVACPHTSDSHRR